MILNGEGKLVPVIGIHGSGGSGKSTLAEKIYNRSWNKQHRAAWMSLGEPVYTITSELTGIPVDKLRGELKDTEVMANPVLPQCKTYRQALITVAEALRAANIHLFVNHLKLRALQKASDLIIVDDIRKGLELQIVDYLICISGGVGRDKDNIEGDLFEYANLILPEKTALSGNEIDKILATLNLT